MKKVGTKIKEWLWMYKNIKRIKGFFFPGGVLYDQGWIVSSDEMKILDGTASPIPWYSYSAVEFLKERLNITMDVFEYGCGYSTEFYASKVRSVTFIEENENWFKEVMQNCNKKVSGRLCSDKDEYIKGVCDTEKLYDIIVLDCVDYGWRVECSKIVAKNLKLEGVIILDDAELPHVDDVRVNLYQQGFRSIKFWGGASGIQYFKCTEIFYRDGNVLKI